jgi:hypothetical protein
MRLRLIFALLVFAGSYLPLSMILLAQNYEYGATGASLCWRIWGPGCHMPFRNAAVATSIFLFCLVSFLVTLLLLALVKPKHEIQLTEAKYVPTDLMNYTLPYVVSFMSIDYQDAAKFVGLIIFLTWMFWITFRSGQIFLNPVLIVFGWRLYDIQYYFASDTKQIKHSDILLIKPNPLES